MICVFSAFFPSCKKFFSFLPFLIMFSKYFPTVVSDLFDGRAPGQISLLTLVRPILGASKSRINSRLQVEVFIGL